MREKMFISGVNDVERFDDVCVILKTECGTLTIDGKNLKMSVLDTEKCIVTLEGFVESLYYVDSNKTEKKNFFGKIFS